MSDWNVNSPLASGSGNDSTPEARTNEPLMTLTVNVHGEKYSDVELQWQTSAAAQEMDRHRLVRAAIEALRQESARIAES